MSWLSTVARTSHDDDEGARCHGARSHSISYRSSSFVFVLFVSVLLESVTFLLDHFFCSKSGIKFQNLWDSMFYYMKGIG